MTSTYLNKKYLPTPALEKFCRGILYTLVTLLIFEGIIRKLLPSAIGTVIFFLKDILCLATAYLIFDKISYQPMFSLKQKWIWVCLALIPPIVYTFAIDPLQAIFGAKQYLLFTVVAIQMQYCFFTRDYTPLRKFLSYFTVLLIPTTAVAMLQNSLPASSWLNQSVGGGSLEGFSAVGYLRVSSTFSFTGQYSWYLNVAAPLVITSIVLTAIESKKIKMQQWVYWSALVVCYVIGIFITGGRTAVFGAMTVLGIGFFCLMLKRPIWTLTTGLIIFAIGSVLIGNLKKYKPEYFAVYTERSKGDEFESNEDEMVNRISSGLFDWTKWFVAQDLPAIIMGNGLGVMSNGADQVSSYAKRIRSKFWTEGDTATIFWEGGVYLGIIWYLFRLFVIVMCFRIYWSFQEKRLNFAAAFLFGYIAITGVIGAISIQPPIAIWWWLAVGVLICLKYNEPIILKQNNAAFLQLKRRIERRYAREPI